MPEDNFDDGLVHNHSWALEPALAAPSALPCVPNAASVPTPSTVLHDDQMHAP